VTLSRRQFLLGGAAALAVGGGAAALLDPRDRTRLLESAQGTVDSHLSTPRLSSGITLTDGSFRSAARGTGVGFTIATPRGASGPLPLVVLLHGRGGTHRSAFRGLNMDAALAEVAKQGKRVALVSVDGGSHSYYHRRADGDDPERMIRDELAREVGKRVELSDRVGLMGWSMGGYGALLLAMRAPDRFHAVAACSAAIWRRWEDSAPGAFDSRADFASHDLLRDASRGLATTPVRLVCGRSDPFIATDRALAKAVPTIEAHFPQGAHTDVFWRRHNTEQLRFLAARLA
jgi:S-formylglutathione hydrolase FrmB